MGSLSSRPYDWPHHNGGHIWPGVANHVWCSRLEKLHNYTRNDWINNRNIWSNITNHSRSSSLERLTSRPYDWPHHNSRYIRPSPTNHGRCGGLEKLDYHPRNDWINNRNIWSNSPVHRWSGYMGHWYL